MPFSNRLGSSGRIEGVPDQVDERTSFGVFHRGMIGMVGTGQNEGKFDHGSASDEQDNRSHVVVGSTEGTGSLLSFT